MELKQKVEELVDKVINDKDLSAKFQKDPSGTIKELVGVDIPQDQLDQAVTMVKAKLTGDKLSDTLGGLFGKK